MPLGTTSNLSPVDIDTTLPNTGDLDIERVYSGEVLSAFISKTIMEQFVTVKVLTHGVSMRFPVIGIGKKEDVKTHVAGTEIDIGTKSAGEVVIAIGSVEYDSVFIDNKEAKVLDFDVTAPFTKNLGQSLAQKLDTVLAGLLYTASITPDNGVAGQPDGSYIENLTIASATTKEEQGNAIVDSIFEANARMDVNNVPNESRIFITDPLSWWAVSQASKTRNSDFTTKNGGVDVFSMDVIWIGNTMVIASNNLTLSNGFVGYLFTPDAIGLVKFISVITESKYFMERMGNVILSKYCYGAGILNAGCVVGVRNTDAIIA
jgi:hypothetical protein